MSDIDRDPAEVEADLIDLRAQLLEERKGISKYAAYQELLSTPEGLRLLADVALCRKRYNEESDLRHAADWLEKAQVPQGRRSQSGVADHRL